MYILVLLLSLSLFCEAPQPITMMTFNVRYDNSHDGENSWLHRKDLVVETIQSQNPSIVAIQEALPNQLDFIVHELEDYKIVGEPRDGLKSEFSGLLIESNSLQILDSGQLWLSETPHIKGSVGWDAALTRTATWAKLKKKNEIESTSFIVIGTHFDHKGHKSRIESAKLITQKAIEFGSGSGTPVAILGDLNCSLESTAMKVFGDAKFQPALSENARGTFHSFSGETDGPRIDFMLFNDLWVIEKAAILRPRDKGMSASDHDPVVVICDLHNISKKKVP